MNHVDAIIADSAFKILSSCKQITYLVEKARIRTGQPANATLLLQTPLGTLVESIWPSGAFKSHGSARAAILPQTSISEIMAIYDTADGCTAVTSFSAMSIGFCARLCLPPLDESDRALRFELLAIVDCFALAANRAIDAFAREIMSPVMINGNDSATPGPYAVSVIEKALQLSSEIECLVLLDGDGFSLCSAGDNEKADGLAGECALFGNRAAAAVEEITRFAVKSMTIASNNRSILIGQMPEKDLYLGISACGPHTDVKVEVLYGMILSAMGQFVTAESAIDATGNANQWGHKDKVTRARYLSVNGSAVFHTPRCTMVDGEPGKKFRRFVGRAEAMQSGMQPCSICNP